MNAHQRTDMSNITGLQDDMEIMVILPSSEILLPPTPEQSGCENCSIGNDSMGQESILKHERSSRSIPVESSTPYIQPSMVTRDIKTGSVIGNASLVLP